MDETEVIETTITEDMVLGTTIGRLSLPSPEVAAVPAHPTGSGSYSLEASEVASVSSAHPAEEVIEATITETIFGSETLVLDLSSKDHEQQLNQADVST